MSEIKRVALTTFGTDKGESKKQKTLAKTVRISLTLPESNEGTCPVYNYKEELAAAKKRDKSKINNNENHPNGLDPFGEDDDDVRRIAQEMEAKYGMTPAKKKRKGRKDDYADIGMGYDESDSFIDNTEGYDEIIPQNVTTLHGGFYINCGALEFKTDDEASSEISSPSSSSSSSDDEEEEPVPEKTSRKRVLESSESEGEKETDKGKENEKAVQAKKAKLHNVANGEQVVKKKKLVIPEKFKQLKKKCVPEDPKKKMVKDLLKEKREGGNVVNPTTENRVEKIDKGDIVMKENKKPACLDNMNDIIDSVAKGDNNNKIIDSEAKKEITKEIVNKDVLPVTTNIVNSKPVLMPSSEGENSNDSSAPKEVVQLPEHLPENVLEIVNKIKETALRNTENNIKIFTQPLKTLILSLERTSRCLGKQSKMKVYQHLSYFVKCKRETLVRRAKNLVIEDDTKRLKQLMGKIKSKIEEIMPPLLEAYEKESLKVVQKKFSIEGNENDTDNKQLRLPKRKFTWTEDIKKLLKEIISIRKRCFVLEGKGVTKEALDAQLNNFIKSELQTLWPEGWMSMTHLTKVCTNFIDKKSPSPMKLVNPININKEEVKTNLAKDIQKLPPSTNDVKIKEGKEKSVPNPAKENSSSAGAKEMQKLVNNSMLSIIPVEPKTAEVPKSKPPKNELSINKIDNDILSLPIDISRNSGLSITPTVVQDKPKETAKKTDEMPIIKPVKTETLLKSSDKTDKTTNFIHPQNDFSITNVQKPEPPLKLTKPPTDHKIENIIKPSSTSLPKSSPENLTKPKTSSKPDRPENLCKSKPENLSKLKGGETSKTKPENLVKQKSENLIKNKSEITSKSKPENLVKSKPENLVKSKPENLVKSKPENLVKSKPENLVKSKPENLVKSKPENLVKSKPENLVKVKSDVQKGKTPDIRHDDSEIIILDDTITEPIVQEPCPSKSDTAKSNQTVDFATTELKRKPGPKSKTKYYDPTRSIKPVRASLTETSKNNPLLPTISDLHNLFPENLPETEMFYNIKKARTESNSLTKNHNDGDDIQKVMENLKFLQKMSTPVKNDSLTSSPVSVIAFNKSYTPKSTTPTSSSLSTSPKTEVKTEFGVGFQEAYQRQFLNDLSAIHSTPISSNNYNSAHSSSSSSHQEKYYQSSNNNYTQNPKYKNNFPTQQTGAYNLMDDMLANFITEYAYPKTANHKPKPPQK